MGRNRKRVAGRAAKRGDVGGKGDPAQAHTAPTMQTPHDAAGPETSGFFDVSTLKTIRMTVDPAPVAPPSGAPSDAESTSATTDADSGDRGDGGAEIIAETLAHHTDSVDDGGSTLVDGNADEDGKLQGETTSKEPVAVPVDAAPVQRAYDLFARLRVWSAASASAERSVIVDDPSVLDESVSTTASHDSKRDDGDDVRGTTSHAHCDAEPNDGSPIKPGDGVEIVDANASPGSCAADRICVTHEPTQGESRLDAPLPIDQDQGGDAEVHASVGLETATSPVACVQTEADTMGRHAQVAPAHAKDNVDDESKHVAHEFSTHEPHPAPDGVDTTAPPSGTEQTASCLEDCATRRGDKTVHQKAAGSASPLAPSANRATAVEATYGTWTPVDEPGWTADAVAAFDAHASRAVAGKASPRIVVFSHGTASSALAAVRRFGPDAIVWVVSSAPDARNIERHGCSVVRWPARATPMTSDGRVSVRDLASAIPWHRVDVVVDIGTGRLHVQRAHTLTNLVPLMRGGSGIYVCAADCRQAAFELLRSGAAAIVHEHDHVVVVESVRAASASRI
ncbi:hypothetical protein pneo_cds_353 [Pandoravirus neocaledonia]|uniref:Uncharacterized protein n=1 Tax=Pandoravirus neocaledonia TaxID=2107708 RepID=A0A2U7UCA9_9VIRU|nr:hypothetical protein pneo_cds_353 [Pandoravirus neocaledonia]AVK75960.1 hypothetical protein pneo_cds_353 [Pandoravirus neocaledonia]